MDDRRLRELLQARRDTLLAELAATDEKLRLETRYLELHRRERWGVLGTLWSRVTTREPTPLPAMKTDGSIASLEQSVRLLSRTLALRWFELSRRRALVDRYVSDFAARIARQDHAARRSGKQIAGAFRVVGQWIGRVLGRPR